NEKLSSSFLAYSLLAREGALLQMVESAGHGTGRLDTDALKDFIVRVPQRDEQDRIVNVLATWDTAIEKTEQLIAAKERYYTHELSRLINQGYHPLKNIGNERRAQLREFLTESRVLDTQKNPSKRLTVRLHLQGVEARVVRGTESEGATTYFRRKSGQLIYGKQNIFRGAIGIIPAELDGYCSTQDLPAFDISYGIDSQWLLYWLSRKSFYVALESMAAGSGSKRLHPDEFLRVSIKVPDLDTQTAIACYLNALREEISTLGVYVEKLKEQKRGLMQKLLTGRWRVQTERNEVPA
ncbi:MAG: restriction endonuclease subunit S, partial [Burkholderiales bacterium]